MLQPHLMAAESDGWIPSHPVDAQSLLDSGELTFEVKRGLLDSKVVLLSAQIDLVRAEAYRAVASLKTRQVCPGGEHEISRFDVNCRMCGYYLPSRSSDRALTLRLTRHWQVFQAQRLEAREQAALAEAKAGAPGVGATVVKAVGFGLLGLGVGIARGVADGIKRDAEDERSQRNMREAYRASRQS